jgi:hypothetical protein
MYVCTPLYCVTTLYFWQLSGVRRRETFYVSVCTEFKDLLPAYLSLTALVPQLLSNKIYCKQMWIVSSSRTVSFLHYTLEMCTVRWLKNRCYNSVCWQRCAKFSLSLATISHFGSMRLLCGTLCPYYANTVPGVLYLIAKVTSLPVIEAFY